MNRLICGLKTKLKKVYFDQNAWQYLIDVFPVHEFAQKLKCKQIEICLGIDNIYEFSRCFLDESNSRRIERGKQIFRYLEDVNISYFLSPTNHLIDSDFDYARTGGRTLPSLDQLNTIAAREEIHRLASGWYNKAKAFVEKKEDQIAEHMPKYRKAIIQANLNLKTRKEFCKLRDDWGNRRRVLNGSEFCEKARHFSDSMLFSVPKKYPYLNTFINAQIYMNFIALTNPKGPSKKVISDFRHLIATNASDLFVTKDKKLLRNSQRVNPFISICSWDEFEEQIRN